MIEKTKPELKTQGLSREEMTEEIRQRALHAARQARWRAKKRLQRIEAHLHGVTAPEEAGIKAFITSRGNLTATGRAIREAKEELKEKQKIQAEQTGTDLIPTQTPSNHALKENPTYPQESDSRRGRHFIDTFSQGGQFQELMEELGMTDRVLVSKGAGLLAATKKIVVGPESSLKDVPDNETQYKAWVAAMRLKGHLKENIEVVHRDATLEDIMSRAAALKAQRVIDV